MSKNLNLKEPAAKFIERIKEIDHRSEIKPLERIKVSYAARSISFLYEKIRNIVDYKDEYLFRKFAIERILNRVVFIEGKRENLGEFILTELVRGRYFPNDSIGIEKIGVVDGIIYKYLAILDNADLAKHSEKNVHQAINWMVSAAAFEIDKNLSSYEKEEALAEFMYDTVKKDIAVGDGFLSERDVIVQVYLAIMRSIFKADRAILSFYLLKMYWPDLFSGTASSASMAEFGKNIFSIKNTIDREIDHSAGEKFFRFIKKRAVVYLIVFDLITKKTAEIHQKMTSDKLAFLGEVQQAASSRYKKAREVLSRSFKRSVLYIFITKIILAFIIEVPYELYMFDAVNRQTLAINVIFHPVLLYAVGSSIKTPKKKNTAQIIREAEYIIYKKKVSELPPYYAKFSFSRSSGKIFWFLYLIMFVVTFGALVYILDYLNFNAVSGGLFILFLSVVSFFAFKIGYPVRELTVVDKRDSLIDVLSDFFYLPIVHFGRWMAERFSQVNIFVFILDFIIEVPFKSFMKIFDDWVKFLKEKREEMTER